MYQVSDEYLKRAHFLLNNVGLTAELEIQLTKVIPGSITGEIRLKDKHMNFSENVHGGTYFSLADTIGGFAVTSMGRYCTTINGTIHYLRASAGCNKLICHAKVINQSTNLAWVETKIENEHGDLLSTCELNYFLLEEIEY